MNIGFIEAINLSMYDCFIFHDVDMIPEDDHTLYTCGVHPRLLTVSVTTDRVNYRVRSHMIIDKDVTPSPKMN